jgi:enoyl-CoA hydratase/carnithine racemase
VNTSLTTPPGGAPTLSIANGIAHLQLQRPAQHNRLQADDLNTLEHHLAALGSNDEARVVLLTAKGLSFCAGFDLRALATGDSLNDPQQLERVINALEALPQPTICALQGDVHGGGIDLALACDFRLGADHISAHMPAAKLGVHYYAHGMRRYVQRLGANAARRMLLSGESLNASTLVQSGLLDSVWPAAQLGLQAQSLAQRLSATPAPVVQGMKRAIREIENGHFDEQTINARWQQSLRDIANTTKETP